MQSKDKFPELMNNIDAEGKAEVRILEKLPSHLSPDSIPKL
jgi:hypothetical protein